MIALTGYSGFIGQHLLAELNSNECLLLGRSFPKGKHQFYELDLASINSKSLLASLKPVSTLIHLAAHTNSSLDTSKKLIAEYREINTLATVKIAEIAAEAGVKRFIYLSSIKVNGEQTADNLPFTVKDTIAPIDAYGISKAEAEHQLLMLGERTGMEIVIIRPPLVYGEGVKANFASLMSLVAKGIPLPLRLINKNSRSLVSVYNLIDLIKFCIEHPKAANQVFLVSDDDDLSTAQIIAMMSKVQGRKNIALPVPRWCLMLVAKLFNKTNTLDKLTGSLQLDITHTKSSLGWHPPYSVEYGFKLAAKQTNKLGN